MVVIFINIDWFQNLIIVTKPPQTNKFKNLKCETDLHYNNIREYSLFPFKKILWKYLFNLPFKHIISTTKTFNLYLVKLFKDKKIKIQTQIRHAS